MSVDGALSFARRWAVVGLVGSAVLWLCFFGKIAWDLHEQNFNLRRTVICADHLAFYTGARLTRFGPEDKLYDYVFVSSYQAKLFEPDVWKWLEAFRNPPFYSLLYWPTCGWTYFYSASFWLIAGLVLTALGTWWLRDGGRYWRRLAWVLSFYPTFAAFDYGQNTPISFALFAATYCLLRNKRPYAAGLVAGFLLFKPNLLLGLGVWALCDLRRLWVSVLGVLTTGLLLAAISATVLPVATQGFLETFRSNLKFDSFEQHKMHNPLAFARLLWPSDKLGNAFGGETEKHVRQFHNAFAIVCGLAAVYAFYKLWRRRRDDLSVIFGGAVFLTLFANPHTLIYEWMLLAITGLLWFREWGNRPNTWFALYLSAWGVLYFSTDLNGWILQWSPATIQWSVLTLAIVGWYAVRLLTKPQTIAVEG